MFLLTWSSTSFDGASDLDSLLLDSGGDLDLSRSAGDEERDLEPSSPEPDLSDSEPEREPETERVLERERRLSGDDSSP